MLELGRRRTLQFNLKHVFLLTTVVAVFFAGFRLQPIFSIVFCPFWLGPIVAYAVSPTRGALIAGLLSAVFWSCVVGFTMLLFCGFVSSVAPHVFQPDTRVKFMLAVVSLLTSSVGGYVGARVHLH